MKNILNEMQLKAVKMIDNPVVVCAGAGSGKTRVIAHRVAYIVTDLSYDSSSILCVTFTNKAAREMKERISSLLVSCQIQPLVTTFHGFSLYLIRRYGCEIGIDSYSVIDESDQKEILKKIIKAFGCDEKEFAPKKVLSYLSIKESNSSLESDMQSNYKLAIYEKILHEYQLEKKKSKLLDFDDLLKAAVKLLKNEKVSSIVQNRFFHVLVDEYQDTSIIQHELIKLLVKNKDGEYIASSFCVVGDEDQSIYSWRGAHVYNMTHFKKDFPSSETIMLTRNYRSSKEILDLANSVIVNNKVRNHKNLWTDKEVDNSTLLLSLSSGYQEAMMVAEVAKIASLNNEYCAVLYRAHYQSRIIEEMCVAQSIPYKIIGGVNFYERAEIKDILSYIQLSLNRSDKASFLRCCNVPTRGLGDVFKDSFFEFWRNQNEDLSILAIIDVFIDEKKPSNKVKNSLLDLKEILLNLSNKSENPKDAIKWLIEKINYDAHLKKISELESEYLDRKDNINELINAAGNFLEVHSGSSLKDFIDYISLMYTSKEDSSDIPALSLMTLHSAKGLEFSTVMLIGVEEGIFPSFRSTADLSLLEEERRLLYVGITRACNRLICSFAQQRMIWGSLKHQSQSRFIKDFGNCIKYYDISRSPNHLLSRAIEDIVFNTNDVKSYEIDSYIKRETADSLKTCKYISNQKVYHDKFGPGRIIKTFNNNVCEVLFRSGIKKIKSDFLKE
jgi:DNA helicase II / ATP-dependent DNA helicase PcrA